ncbi:MAG: serine/threonine protein kinase [Deltaproteobacteria bacterium]|nr:serine/threonine protein kinase [Deltaproteobacteria bacterium]
MSEGKGAGDRTVRLGDPTVREERERTVVLESDLEAPGDVTATSVGTDAVGAQARAHEGQTIAQYRIVSLLGEGGMARVYRAFDTKLDRVVALKVLVHAESEGPEMREQRRRRLLREARAAAALKHPNVVAIYEIDEDAGEPFIVMELVEGASLREAVVDAPMETRLRWLVEAARALESAHAAGLVHRDVKPENIVIDERGMLRLLDFGIAKREVELPSASAFDPNAAEAPSSLRTTAGRRIGTPRYMAPEQLAGLASDARTDQYAWGLVAFEVLTGRPLERRRDDGGIEPGALGPLGAAEIPIVFAKVVRRALSRDQAGRFYSMTKLIAALESERTAKDGESLVDDVPETVPADVLAERQTTPPPPRRRVFYVVAGAIGLITAAASVTAYVRARAPKPPPPVKISCVAEPERSWSDFRPAKLVVPPGGSVLLGAYAFREGATDGPPSGLELLSMDTGERRDAVEGTMVPPAMVRGRSVRLAAAASGSRPFVVVSRFDALAMPSAIAGRTVLFRLEVAPVAHPELAASRASFEPLAIAADLDAEGRPITAVIGFPEVVGANGAIEKSSSDPYVVAVVPPDSPGMVKIYESSVLLADVAIAVHGTRRAVAFLEGDGVSLVHLDERLELVGSKLSFPRKGELSRPALAFAGETLFVAYTEREPGESRLVVHSADRGGPFTRSKDVDETGVVRDSPRLVPLEPGGALLAWVVSSPAGNRIRAARLGRGPVGSFDLGPIEGADLEIAPTGRGAVVAWRDARTGAAHATKVTCTPE